MNTILNQVNKILTAKQMAQVDLETTELCGVPSLVLMENAGLNLYMVLRDDFRDLEKRRIAIFCGKGNNGGDGFVLARQLVQRGIRPDVYLLSSIETVCGNAQVNLQAYLNAGQSVVEVKRSNQWQELRPAINQYHIIVDALLGTGLSKPLQKLYSQVVSTINSTEAFVLSVDIPSGMFSDALKGGVQTVQATATVTFTAPKVAHILNEDQAALGRLYIVPIGTPSGLLEREEFDLNLITGEQVFSRLPDRETGAHKGHFGHVAIVAGSRGKSGAAVLSGEAALRTGSGLVTVCTPEVSQVTVASCRPELMTKGYDCTKGGAFSRQAADPVAGFLHNKDAAGLGPGLGREPETVDFVHRVVGASQTPLVIDADALSAFEQRIDSLKNDHDQPLVLTPHPGEFSRLTGHPIPQIQSQRVELARQFAQQRGVWVVLKGFRTLVAEPQGQVYACPLGNPGMATAGMGDVLTGVLTSLIGTFRAQGKTTSGDITSAVLLGSYLHSLSGDIAALEVGAETLTAGDVTSHLGRAYRQLAHSRSRPAQPNARL